jgi:hypothetical protein
MYTPGISDFTTEEWIRDSKRIRDFVLKKKKNAQTLFFLS